MHGPTASADSVIVMHRVLCFTLSKLRPGAREVRLQKDERSTRLNVSPLALYRLHDMAHSYEQITFKDSSRSCEIMHTALDSNRRKNAGKDKQKEKILIK